MNLKKDISIRLALIFSFVVLTALVIILRIFFLQFVEDKRWKKNLIKYQYKSEEIITNRGDICADDGRILATSALYYDIRMDLGSAPLADTTFINNVEALADSLSKLFGDKTKEDYLQSLYKARQKKSKYHLIKKQVSYAELQRLKKFPIFKYGKFKGGLIVIENKKRIRPFGMLAARTIGYYRENVRPVGLEAAYDRILHGSDKKIVKRKIGKYWVPVKIVDNLTFETGSDVISTININFQDYAHQTLLAQLKKYDADQGVVILMEVKTGNIKAIVNLRKNDNDKFVEDLNLAVAERTEPGSTFKLPSLMVALEDGYIDMDDSVQTGRGTIKYHGFLIRDSRIGGYGKITVKQAFEHSSNVGISQIIYAAYKTQPEKFVNRLYSMNLNEATGIEIPGEASPIIKYPRSSGWSGISLPQISIGYEVLLTPLQMLNFYNAVANNGVMVKPKLLQAVRKHGKIIEYKKTEILNPSICSKETIKKAHILLEGVVRNGTAHDIFTSKYKIAGKTGTAQIAHGSFGYKDTADRVIHQASFAGYFPADNPKYSCIVVIKTKGSVYYGSALAAPVFRKIADKVYASSPEMQKEIDYKKNYVYPEKGIPYAKDGNRNDLDYVFNELRIPVKGRSKVQSLWVVTKSNKRFVEYQNRFVRKNQIPKVEGMALKDALYILEKLGLKVRVNGRGIIRKQSIPAGTGIRKNMTITLNLG